MNDVDASDLLAMYRGYIDTLNTRDLDGLGRFVHDDVHYNGQWVGLSGYRQMLKRDCSVIDKAAIEAQL